MYPATRAGHLVVSLGTPIPVDFCENSIQIKTSSTAGLMRVGDSLLIQQSAMARCFDDNFQFQAGIIRRGSLAARAQRFFSPELKIRVSSFFLRSGNHVTGISDGSQDSPHASYYVDC